MKHLYLNLKRFDVPAEAGGVNRLAPTADWGAYIVRSTQDALRCWQDDAEFVQFFPEAHISGAVQALTENSPVQIGCQGVYRADVMPGGNFGAFTTNCPAAAAAALGCRAALIGHCEERSDLQGVLAEAGAAETAAVNRILNREILAAQARGLNVLYCVGETSEEQPRWQEVLCEQLTLGLRAQICAAWSSATSRSGPSGRARRRRTSRISRKLLVLSRT